MKQMEEVSQELDAVEDLKFNTTGFVILRAGTIANVVRHSFSGDKDVVLNVLTLRGNFLACSVNVTLLDSLVLHFVARHYLVFAQQSDLNIADRAGLFISGIMRGKIQDALAKFCFRGFISGGND